MLQRIDPLYIGHACRIFQIFNAFSDLRLQPTVLELDLSVTATNADALKPSTGTMSDHEISQRCHRMSTHLKTRCEGLLEVHDLRDRHWEDSEPSLQVLEGEDTHESSTAFEIECRRVKADLKVAYLHRTARDFLAANTVREILLSNTGTIAQFKPNMSILMSYVINLKRGLRTFYCKAPRIHDQVVWSTLCEVLRVCQKIPLKCLYAPLLSEFSKVALLWANGPCPGWHANNIWTPEEWNHSFLSTAVVFGLTSFVESGLNRLSPDGRDILTSLITRALGGPASLTPRDPKDLFGPVEQPLCPSMVNLLLRRGADPNDIDQTTVRQLSVWQFSMYSHHLAPCSSRASSSEEENALAEIVHDMLEHGADQEIKWSSSHDINLLLEWNHAYTPEEEPMFHANNGRYLLQLVNEARVEKGMGLLKSNHSRNSHEYSAAGIGHSLTAAGTISSCSKRRRRSPGNEEDSDLVETATPPEQRRDRFRIDDFEINGSQWADI